jgi:DNA repair protein RecO
MQFSSKSLILNAIKFGDTSKIITCFTEQHGKISLIAKGAFSPKSKFIGTTEPLSFCNLHYLYKPNRDIQTLTDSDLLTNHKLIVKDLQRLAISMLIVESVNQTVEKNAENKSLYNILENIFDLLNTAEISPMLVLAIFEIYHCNNHGYELTFNPLDFELSDELDYVYVSIINGAAARNYSFIKGNSVKLSIDTYKLLHEIKESEHYDGLTQAKFNIKEVCQFFSSYYSYHLDKRFVYKSLYLLD